MKTCPYCNNKISYSTLLSYSSGKGFTKYEECPHCNETYKVTLNIFFIIAIVILVGGIILFILNAETRSNRRAYALALLLLLVPLFPLFMKLSKNE